MTITLANKDATYSCPRRFDTVARTTYTTNKGGPSDNGQFTPNANSLLIAAVVATDNTTAPDSVSGNGVSYTYVTAISLGSAATLQLWVAHSGASPTLGSVSATWSVARAGAGLIVGELAGADLSAGAVASLVQTVTNSGAGTTGTVTLAAGSASGNRAVAMFAHAAATLHSSTDANWVEFHDATFSTPDTAMQTQWRPDLFYRFPQATWSTAAPWGGIAFEVAAAGTVTGVALQITPSLPVGQISLLAVALSTSPSLPAGAVRGGVTAIPLSATPSLPAAEVLSSGIVSAIPLTTTPSLPVAVLGVSGGTGGYLGGYVTWGYVGTGQQNVVVLNAFELSRDVSLPVGDVVLTVTGTALTLTVTLPIGVLHQDKIVQGEVLVVPPFLPKGTVYAAGERPVAQVTPGAVRSTEM